MPLYSFPSILAGAILKNLTFATHTRLKVLWHYVLGWTLSFLFLSIVRGVGTEELGSLQFGFGESIRLSLTLGPMIGLISGTAQLLIEEKWYRRVSVLRYLLLRTLFGLTFLGFLVLVAYWTYRLFFGTEIGLYLFAFDRGSGAIYFYVLMTDLAMSVLREINLMLGEGNLGKMITGKFYHPREEERIFMFLDLQSSTTLAEQLGHLKYSHLIQDCFNDLGVVAEDAAEIYQYVGDEAVLTWPYLTGIKNTNVLNAYFRFARQLASRAGYYEQRYGVLPFFKAGIHGGQVTVTQIGKYKKEIAYHGDPINTAARIQAQCNVLGAALLISAPLAKAMPSDTYHLECVGSLQLKGKQTEVEVYAVHQATSAVKKNA